MWISSSIILGAMQALEIAKQHKENKTQEYLYFQELNGYIK